MRILFTGATGVIGRRAVPLLSSAGHDVIGVARREEDQRWLTRIGARPLEIDLFDPGAVAGAIKDADCVVHMATAIPSIDAMTKRTAWAMNDRLRSEATGVLVDAAIEHGVERFIQQSVTFVYGDGGDRWIDEDAPVHTVWEVLDSALDAERHVARFTDSGGGGIVLRFSSIYGPGRTSADYIDAVAGRRMPLIGGGHNYVSHVHVDDAAGSIVAATVAPPGVYNVTDDVPVRKREELAVLADALGAKRPRSLPRLAVRPVIGPAIDFLAVSQRVSNDRFKDATDWRPTRASIIEGWPEVVASSPDS